MIYGSVCSGIEAATVAWEPLGWTPAFFAEIDPFPSAVLAHHYPEVKNLGDFTTIGAERGPIDLLVGGTPCQSFSVAGLRRGLDDDRGNLALEFLRLAGRLRPRWVVWENVPGVLSSVNHDAPDARPPDIDLDGDDGPRDGEEVVVEDEYDADEVHAFACFLSGLQELGYGFAYRVCDAQYAGVPQRRRRVFVVGYLGSWTYPAAVLFERHSLSGNPPPSREAGQNASSFTPGRIGGYREGIGTLRAHGGDCHGGSETLIAGTLDCGTGERRGAGQNPGSLIAGTLTCEYGKQSGNGMGEMANSLITHTLRADGFDASEDGTGRGTPIIPVKAWEISSDAIDRSGEGDGSAAERAGLGIVEDCSPALRARPNNAVAYNVQAQFSEGNGSHAREDGTSKCLDSHGLNPDCQQGGTVIMQPVAFDWQSGGDARGLEPKETAQLQRSQVPAIAFQERGRDGGRNLEWQEEQSYALRAINGGGCGDWMRVNHRAAVRRLTPLECERLQGFPDDWTLVPYRGKPASDGPRYKAIGNSMAVPDVRRIGQRIGLVDAYARERST